MGRRFITFFCCVSLALGLSARAAYAVTTLPDAADAGRVQPRANAPLPSRSDELDVETNRAPMPAEFPPGVDKIPFTLRHITIVGVTAFSEAEMEAIYAPHLNKKETLAVAWIIAAEITKKYREAGYFLTRAVVPEQQLSKGNLTIKVVEGFIGEVTLDHPLAQRSVIKTAIAELKAHKPISAEVLESFLLRLGDLPDAEFRTVLTPMSEAADAPEGAVMLALVPAKKAQRITAQVDNYSSKFLGPHQATLTYTDSFLPLQRTTLSLLSSLPSDKLRYGIVEHEITIAPEWKIELSGGITRANPGFNLSDFDIESDSRSLGVSVNWQPVRQRQENLSFALGIDGRNTLNDIAGEPLTRDKIRALRATTTFDTVDASGGFTSGNFELSRGIAGLGASGLGDDYLSRAAAVPDFTKAKLNLTHYRNLTDRVLAVASFSGQYAANALYSAEEFGYGGQAFGRAYDPSDLTGDHGVAGALELRYLMDPISEDLQITPYAFYDHGKIWNRDAGQDAHLSASSAGGGVSVNTIEDINANLGLAFPIAREVTNPIYGGSASGPRVLLKISKEF